MSRAAARAASISATGPSEPGTTGRPASCIAFLAAILSPIRRMCSGDGPMKVNSCSSTIAAKSAFSARKPYPGWMASAPAMVAALKIAVAFR